MERTASTANGRPFVSCATPGVVTQADFGGEAVGEHALVAFHQVVVDPGIPDRQAGKPAISESVRASRRALGVFILSSLRMSVA